MKLWYSYKIYLLKKTNRLNFISMRQYGIPKTIIGQIILDEVKNDFNKELASYYKSPRTLNRRVL
ncbi:hypothetical protein GS41_02780 [Candidatus Pseudothioglobus singularis]|nr:hypothetical protein GS41_02780 [Candidatus Pseudothioglobus singularis]